MKHKAHFIIILCLMLLGLTASGSIAAPLGSGFTYQGELQDDSGPVNGRCDFKFSLWDKATAGNQIGGEQTLGGVVIADGRFTVLLNGSSQFGSSPFKGQARWLQIKVRCPAGSGNYTMLQPRQPLSAAPFAAYSQSGPWSGLTGIPAGFADGVDNTGGNKHDHLGQTWKGNPEPLQIAGSFGSMEAPLILNNSGAGDGLRVNSAGNHGLHVTSAGGDGVHVGKVLGDGVRVDGAIYRGVSVGTADGDGIQIGTAGGDGLHVVNVLGDGVHVYSAGDPISSDESTENNGFEVAGAEGNGLFVGSADQDGVHVTSAGYTGVRVDQAGYKGVYVISAGSPSTHRYSTNKNGFEIAGAEGNGLSVGHADNDGVHITSAGDDGVQVSAEDEGIYVVSAGGDGIYIQSATDYAGYFSGDIYVTGSCTGCVLAQYAVNSGLSTLEPGDIVTIQGTAANEFAGQPLLMQVSAAAPGETAIGVVQGRAELQQNREESIEENERNGEGGETEDRLVPREGAAQPGEYVSIAIYGPVQVKAGQLSGQITAGTRLAVDENGRARALQTTEVNGLQVAESAPTIGIALDQPAADGLVWVLVNPQ